MSSNSVVMRVPAEARDALKDVAKDMGITTQELFLELVAMAENRLFFKKMELAYSELADDPEATKVEQDVLDKLDSAVGDGLEGVLHGQPAQAR